VPPQPGTEQLSASSTVPATIPRLQPMGLDLAG
jgi:hypothetical protein